MIEVKCKACRGSGRVPLPRGMSPGFYNFIATGRDRRDENLLMVCYRCDGNGEEPKAKEVAGG
jgi:DnaJ-class molecular chaperone